jgi:glutathione synthase/RimK-type ligase-like ATP-grasp enzyme
MSGHSGWKNLYHMAKNILIITSKSERNTSWETREGYIAEFCRGIEEKLDNFKLAFTTYEDLVFSVIDGVREVEDTRNGFNLDEADMVHFKNTYHNPEEAGLVARYLESKGIQFFNTETNNGLLRSKISQMFALSQDGLPVPDTLYAKKDYLAGLFRSKNLPQRFNLPFIMKADFGSKGEDNYLIKDFDKALEILSAESGSHKEFVIQNFIENDGDYRILFVGLDEPPLIIHRAAAPDSHLNNTSQGGQGSFVEPDTLPQEVVENARRACGVLKREIGGADIIIEKNSGRIFILEVNSTPALATGFGREEKAQRFAEFLRRKFE